MDNFDVVICGAGPAGLSAARTAHDNGLSVAIVDEQPQAGGQIYRNVTQSSNMRHEILGNDYSAGKELALLPDGVRQFVNAQIWNVEPSGSVAFTQKGQSQIVKGEKIILATGALERPVPIKGWTLPGVMSVGAAQTMLKLSGVVPQSPLIVGSGPLIYLYAAQMIRAGYPPCALVETQSWQNTARAACHPIAAWHGRQQIKKGMALLQQIKAANIPRFTGCTDIEIIGEQEAEGVVFLHQGKPTTLKSATVLVHQGIVPNIQISQLLQLEHEWNPRLRCFEPTTNANGQSSNPRFYIVGDGAAIKGAIAAKISGEIAALDISGQLSAPNKNLNKLRASYKKESTFRLFIDELYKVPKEVCCPNDCVIICRCEEVTAGEIRYLKGQCAGVNQIKALSRAGMGACQGRYCGLTVSQICAENTQGNEAGYYRIRPPIKPITLAELASLKEDTNE